MRRRCKRGAARFAVLLLALAAVQAGAAVQQEKAVALNNEGVRALTGGDLVVAIAKLEAAHRLAPRSDTIAGNLAKAYIKQAENLSGIGKRDEAVHWLDQVLGLGVKDVVIRNNLAATYNDIANEYSRSGRYGEAISLLETAVSLEPGSIVLRTNLGLALYRDNRREEALGEFRGVVSEDPRNALARKMYGLILYWKGQMKEALKQLRVAAELNPDDRQVKEILEKIEREYGVEKDFDVDQYVHFTVSFDGRKDYRVGSAVVEALEQAWLSVGSDFNYYPRERISVVIYSNREFRDLLNKPKHVGGLYDGKIRVPVGGLDSVRDRERLRNVLLHEYAHVVVHFLSHGRCPLWLNEGIAEYESEEWTEGKQRKIAAAIKRGNFIPIDRLSDALKEIDSPKKVSLAYVEAFSLVRFIADRYGVYTLRRILDSLDGGAGIDDALTNAVSLTTKGLEEEWINSISSK